MNQRIREAERERKFEEYANREGDIVTGIIQQSDSRYTLLDLGKVEALLPQAEQVPYERPEPNARLKAYIVEVRRTSKGPQIVVSRTHPGLIKRLFELEVPEIADGVVEIKACAREPGHRTKIAVWSNDHNVDPVGACVGARGGRVRMVVTELRGEKIDIVPFSEDPADFVAKALSPAKVKEVRIHEDTGVAEVIVPDYQLSLAIGKEGQNARLAARLTGWRVDIKSETPAGRGGGRRSGARTPRTTSSTPRASGCRNADTGELEWHSAEGEVVTAQEWAGEEPTAEAVAAEAVAAAPTRTRRRGADGGRGGRGGRMAGRRSRSSRSRSRRSRRRGRRGRGRRGRGPGRRRLSGPGGRPLRTCVGLPAPGRRSVSWSGSPGPLTGAWSPAASAPGRGAWLCAGSSPCLASPSAGDGASTGRSGPRWRPPPWLGSVRSCSVPPPKRERLVRRRAAAPGLAADAQTDEQRTKG